MQRFSTTIVPHHSIVVSGPRQDKISEIAECLERAADPQRSINAHVIGDCAGGQRPDDRRAESDTSLNDADVGSREPGLH